MRRRIAALAALAPGCTLVLAVSIAAAQPATGPRPPRSGFDTMAPATRAMQRDDAANPGMLWVREGEAAWSRPDGEARRACSDCHGGARSAMRGAAKFMRRISRPAAKPAARPRCFR